MPEYDFEQVDKPEVKSVFFFSMKDCPKVGSTWKDENGISWKRLFTVPNTSVDSKIDPNSVQDFVEKTGKKKGTFGDILDASKELSDKRAKDRGGIDPVQKKFFKEYKDKRHGIEHLQEKKKKKVDKADFSINYS